jgi:hypothetical protein
MEEAVSEVMRTKVDKERRRRRERRAVTGRAIVHRFVSGSTIPFAGKLVI